MSTSAVFTALSASVSSFPLLEHPYYRAWQNGELRNSDLKRYAEQYRHFEQCLPEVLAAGIATMEQGEPRRLTEANLQDELSNPRPHIEMFDDFAAAVGAVGEVGPTKATSELVRLYRDASEAGPVPLLAVVAAYESQAADIAETKAKALSDRYSLNPAGTEFWTAHASAERHHSAWTLQALELLQAENEQVAHWSGRSAHAWWQFLDEHESSRAA